MDSTREAPEHGPAAASAIQKKKKRLSRKEQKARKKQRLAEPRPREPDATPAGPTVPHAPERPAAPYVPTPIPTVEELGASAASSRQGRSLGRWFPRASVIKSPVAYSNAETFKDRPAPTASLVLFYQYVEPPWPEARADLLAAYLARAARARVLGGRIRVAREGVNATLSSVDTAALSAREALEHLCRDLRRFDGVFQQTDFKFIDRLSPDRHFAQLKIFPVQELVFYGVKGDEAPLRHGGVHLPPKDFHEMLSRGKQDTVVIDVRNHYEAAIGRFDGQEQGGGDGKAEGATYIDPKMRKSTDFTTWLDQEETQQRLEGKNVMMYCTGGVRCERASAVLNKKLGDKVKGVFQLKGGIEAYLKEFQSGGHWRGKNFVFDKREAVAVNDPNGDGGVIKRLPAAEDSQATCCVCQIPWDRYVGKKKCSTCGVPVLMCNGCMSKKSLTELQVRCPLCVEQGITVRAADVEFTDNGIKGKAPEHIDGKAAPSVLKWGGGTAASKKDKRRFAKIPCSFGSDCRRRDCFFQHPSKSS